MIKRLTALVWLRTQVLLSNTTLLATILLPYGLLVLYNQFMNADGQHASYMVFMCLSLAFSVSLGSLTSLTIAEDKEKKNLKSLLLSGVRNGEYLLSALFYPVVVGLVTIVSFPMIVDADFGKHSGEYYVVAIVVGLCIVLLNLLIASLSNTQSQAQVNGLVPMMAISFLPLFSGLSETASKIAHYTFMGVYVDFFTKESFELSFETIGVALAWLVGLFLVNLIVLNPTRKEMFLAKLAKKAV